MTDFARLVLDADTKGLKTAQTDLMGVSREAGRTAQEVGRSMQKLGVGLTVGVTAPLTLFGKGAFQAASDAQEMQGAFDVVFGEMAADVQAWAEVTGNALGRSTQEIQRGALAFQELFGKALDPQQAADLSKEFAVLTQDLASFKNLSNEVAQQKLFSGLTGEAEPLRAVGVFINDAAVKAKGLELGLGGVNGALTDQEKIVARAALIQEQLSNAQGDVVRTADSTANQIKASAAAFEELQIQVGTKLLPALTPLIEKVGALFGWFAQLPSPVQSTILVVAGLAAALGPLLTVFGTIATVGSAVGTAFGLISGTGAAAGAGTAAAGAGATVGATGFAALSLAAAPWIALAAGIAAAGYLIYDNWDIIAPVFEELGAVISSWYNDSVKPAFDAFTEAIGPIVELFVDHFGAQIKDTITLISQLFTGDFSGAWDTAKNIVNRSIEAIISIVGTVGGAVYDAFVDMANRAAGALREFAGDMVEIGSNIIAGLINGIKSGATAVYNTLTNIVQTGYNNVKEFLGIQSPSRLFMSVGSFIGAGLAQGIENSQPVVDEAFAGLTSGAETVSNGVVQSFEQMAQGVTRSVSTLANSIKDGGFLGILEGAIGLFGQLAGSGIFGSSLQTSFGGAPSFNGGGFTGNAPRSGGLDGQGGFMAMLHPRETVVDHTRGQSSGQSVVVINNSAMAEVFIDGQIQRAAPAIANAGARVADANNSLRQSRTVRR